MIKIGSISISDSVDYKVAGPQTYCTHCQKETEYHTQMSNLPVPTENGTTMLWLESAYCTECRHSVYSERVAERNKVFIDKA